MTPVATVLTPCEHGRLRPHAWRCTCEPGAVHGCWAPWVPDDTLIALVSTDTEEVATQLRWRHDPHLEVDLCRCGALIAELLAGGYRHLDPVAEAGCLDTHPVVDP
jgi:hypothetical protein